MRPYDSLVDRGFNRFVTAYNQPGFDFNVNVARLIVCAFLIWKLLSRDFGFFGHVPEQVFYFYPIEIYPLDKWVLWTGLPVLSEVLTFHWLHWFIPRPGETALRVIQGVAIGSLLLLALFGRGPRNAILIVTYCVLIYLWGYVFLLGQDVDAVDLYFGILIALAVSTFAEVPIWRLPALYDRPKTVDGGRSFSNVVLVLVLYYFASGMRKLTDITPIEWFRYDLVEAIEEHSIRAAHGTLGTFDVFQHLHGLTFLNYVGPPAAYLSHLLVPMVFFRRSLILKFFLFYFAFHLLTFGVGISFSGYILVWSVLFPYREMMAWVAKRFRTLARGATGART